MPEPELNTFCEDRSTAALLAIVSVEHADRVRCAQPTCGHSVYRRIHIVSESGKLLVLGSTCFERRYGTATVLGMARFGGGEGRMLTNEERQLLLNNTQALLAQFEEEAASAHAAQQVVKALPSLPPRPVRAIPQPAPHPYHQETPWAWVKPWSSVIYLELADGSGWMRAQRKDDKQLLVPWPIFDGWEEALPPLFGPVDPECGGHVLPDVVAALKYLRSQSDWETKPGRWKDVVAEIASRTSGSGRPQWR
jgi:hypothetical protein